MQLSDLLRRMTASERATLVERRNVPPSFRSNDKSLTEALSTPSSVIVALAELGVAQIQILDWLATRPNLRASWSDLLADLKGRVPDDLLLTLLQDQRLMGLLDFKADARSGYVETYPAAVAVLPSARQRKLIDRLRPLNSDVVGRMCSSAGIRNAPTRKDDRVAALNALLTDPDRCRALVRSLSAGAQQLFAEIVERRSAITLDELHGRFKPSGHYYYGGAYWTVDAIWLGAQKNETPDPVTELMRCALLIGDAQYNAYWTPTSYFIPADVRSAFSGEGSLDGVALVPPRLEPADVATSDSPNIGPFLRDLGHLVGFVATGQCEWRQDGQPYKRSLTALGKLIGNSNESYLAQLWLAANASGLLTPAGRPGSLAQPPVTAARLGDGPPKQLFQRVLMGLLSVNTVVLDRGGLYQLTDSPLARVLLLLKSMPTDTWVTAASVEAWSQFTWPITFKPELVGLSGTPYPVVKNDLGRLVLVHGTTADGVDAVMFPSAMYAAVDPNPKVSSTALPPWEDSWIVQPDRTIVAPPNLHIDALVDLWQIANLESNQGASVFRISAQSISRALNEGLTPAKIREKLTQGSRVPLPATIERLIDDQSARYGRIKVGAASTFVQTDVPELLDELRRNAKLKDLAWVDVVPGVAFVQGNSPDDVIAALRKAGHLPVRAEAEKKVTPSPAGKSVLQVINSRPLAPKEIRRLVRQAEHEDRVIYVTHSSAGKQKTDEMLPIDLHSNELHAELVSTGRDVEIDFLKIHRIELGEPASELDDDEYDPFDESDETRLDFIQALDMMIGRPRNGKKPRR
ncbi:MAG: helicase-associated domain-containing protein [Chloroflexi bacterium]|nr:helicase-associated domain-containing protein [Chloroflexota bacterium]